MTENQLSNVKFGSSLVFYGSDVQETYKAARGLAQFVGVSDFDITEIEPDNSSKNSKGEIGIKSIKELIRQISLSPSQGAGRMAIIKDADRLGHEASNALLKTLEEPAKTSIIILLSSDLKQIATILSRCQVIRFSDKTEINFEQASEFGWPKENLARKFKKIDELSKDENLEAYLESLLNILRRDLEQEPEQNIVDKISAVFEAKKQLRSTTSKRLVLENLLLKFC